MFGGRRADLASATSNEDRCSITQPYDRVNSNRFPAGFTPGYGQGGSQRILSDDFDGGYADTAAGVALCLALMVPQATACVKKPKNICQTSLDKSIGQVHNRVVLVPYS